VAALTKLLEASRPMDFIDPMAEQLAVQGHREQYDDYLYTVTREKCLESLRKDNSLDLHFIAY